MSSRPTTHAQLVGVGASLLLKAEYLSTARTVRTGHVLSIQSPADGYLRCLYLLAAGNRATVTVHIPESLRVPDFHPFRLTPRNAPAESGARSVGTKLFRVLRDCLTVSRQLPRLPSHKPRASVLLSPHLLFRVLVPARVILGDVREYVTVVFTCIY